MHVTLKIKALWCRGNTQILFHIDCCSVIWVDINLIPFTDLMMDLTSIYEVLKMTILAWRQSWGFVCIYIEKFFGISKDRTSKIVWDQGLWRYIYCFHLWQPIFYTQGISDITIREYYIYLQITVPAAAQPLSS